MTNENENQLQTGEKKLYNYTQNRLNFKTTTEIGEITPIFWTKLFPGERLENLNFQNLTRMITPELPTLDNPYIDIYTFAIPRRLLVPDRANLLTNDSDYYLELNEDFIKYMYDPAYISKHTNDVNTYLDLNPYSWKNGNTYGPSGTDYSTPAYKSYLSGRNLFSRFGINKDFLGMVGQSKIATSPGLRPNNDPKDVKTLSTSINIMYLLAYWKVYESFFKQKQLENFTFKKIITILEEATNDPGPNIEKRVITNKVIANNPNFNLSPDLKFRFESLLTMLNSIAVANVDNDYINELIFERVNTEYNEYDFNYMMQDLGRQYANNRMILDQLKDGTNKDLLLKIWGANNKDKTNAELIGYNRFTQYINQVVQTAGSDDPTSNNALGAVGGYSTTANEGSLCSQFVADEETYILTLAVPNYKMVINNAFEQTEWLNYDLTGSTVYPPFLNGEFMPNYENVLTTPEPLFMYLDETKQYNSSIVKKNAGFKNAYTYLRFKKDAVAGQFPSEFNDWNYSAKLNSENSINMSLLKVQAQPFKKTLIDGTDYVDSFIFDFNLSYSVMRHIKPVAMVEDLITENKNGA